MGDLEALFLGLHAGTTQFIASNIFGTNSNVISHQTLQTIKDELYYIMLDQKDKLKKIHAVRDYLYDAFIKNKNFFRGWSRVYRLCQFGNVVVVCLQIGLAWYVTDGDFYDYGYKVMNAQFSSGK